MSFRDPEYQDFLLKSTTIVAMLFVLILLCFDKSQLTQTRSANHESLGNYQVR